MSIFSELKENKHKRHIFLFFFIFGLFLIFFTSPNLTTDNIVSRFLTIEAIVERGDFVIDDKAILTSDKIYREGHYYSSKPPLLPIAASVIYFVMHNFFNQNFPDLDEHNIFAYRLIAHPTVYFTSLIFVALPIFFLLIYFYKILILLGARKEYHLFLLSGLGLGTLYLTYAATFNNHTIAGSFIFIAFYYLLLIKEKADQGLLKKRIFLTGLFTSLAAVIDLPTGLLFFGMFFLYLFFQFGIKQSLYYLLPAIFLFSLHLYFNYQMFGGFLPAQYYKEYWVGPDGQWINLEASPHFFYKNSWYIYIFNILIGTHGLFSYSPILILAVLAIYRILKTMDRYFWEAILVIFTFTILILFYTLFSRAYGGLAYGFRWFIPITPIIYFFIIFLFREKISKRLSFWSTILFIWSFIVAFIGIFNPWQNGAIFTIGDEIFLMPPFITTLSIFREIINVSN